MQESMVPTLERSGWLLLDGTYSFLYPPEKETGPLVPSHHWRMSEVRVSSSSDLRRTTQSTCPSVPCSRLPLRLQLLQTKLKRHFSHPLSQVMSDRQVIF